MQKKSKLLIGIQIGVLMIAVALPAQAAVLIGGSQALSGSVVTLRSSAYGITQVSPTPSQGTQTTVSTPTTTNIQNPAPTQSPSVSTGQPSSSGNVVSLKNIPHQPTSIPVTATSPAPSSTTTTPSTTTPSLPAIPTVTALTADEQLMVDMINQERATAGVSPVTLDLRLASVGRAKANDLKANNYFDHASPTYGSPWAMMQQVGLTVGWAGENIAGNDSVAGAMTALMLDPGHRANILDPRFTNVGVGIAYGSAYGNLYVQEFLQE
ncbi:SCP-like extracellular family protein [Candidatus Desulfosporosinus infrequens]|uniref:SCP-like extracellular family protein n=1 Tax=Candidatus Desulfosporosinus infrequens TaxID=2043169 RepID=A0A2U3L1L8_9FIRM|nr:SCP-like extracellular family protein [Candidatus Desulfosporosinus infrequens]